jgi:hypothetical protein
MLTSWQEQRPEFVLTLGRFRSALRHVGMKTQRTAAEHERMAAWYAEHGDELLRGCSATRLRRTDGCWPIWLPPSKPWRHGVGGAGPFGPVSLAVPPRR